MAPVVLSKNSNGELAFPLARVKKTMMLDAKGVRHVSKEALLLTTRAAEVFVEYLAMQANRSKGGKRKGITEADMFTAIRRDPSLEFLQTTIAEEYKAPPAREKTVKVVRQSAVAAAAGDDDGDEDGMMMERRDAVVVKPASKRGRPEEEEAGLRKYRGSRVRTPTSRIAVWRPCLAPSNNTYLI